ncbi:MAG: hypothetical protein SVV67_04255 [Bacillota bacterium]|nr:hypothetical protein [Bacillota bacterium]
MKIKDSELFGVQHDENRPDTSEFEELFGSSEPDYKEQKRKVILKIFSMARP